jgi:hypothetical protein
VGHLVKERARFLNFVGKEIARLLRRLQPQWEARDAIRNRMGNDRWSNNPNPKLEYAQRREQDEQTLRQVQLAQAVLQNLEADALRGTSDELQHRLASHDQQPQPSSGQVYRYNGLRPTNDQDRVSMLEYPDPTEFSWIFTGSNEASSVEFFERVFDYGLVKLDWFYTTGTVKTSMDHPAERKTQLFGKRVTPELYRQILVNPRQHTNVRYKTKRGGGRGGGRGRGFGRGRGRGQQA